MKKRLPLFVSFLLFVALSASIAYWWIELTKPQARPMAATQAQVAAEIPLDAALGIFGGRQAVAAASNYQLKGVVAAKRPNEGVALLVENGKPAQAVGVGGEVSPGVSLKEVHPMYVLLSDGGVVKRVDLPEAKKSEGVSYAQQADAQPTTSRMTGPQLPQPQVDGSTGTQPPGPVEPQQPPQQGDAPPPPPPQDLLHSK